MASPELMFPAWLLFSARICRRNPSQAKLIIMKITDLFAPFPDELQLSATPRLSSPPLVEWASAFGDLFLRVKGADPQTVWCVLGRGAPAKRPLSKARLATLGKYLSASYGGRTFFRVVPFEGGDDWALVRPKRALVKSPVQRKGAIWQWSADFTAPNGEINWLSQSLGWFENWLPDPRATQEARDFARLSDYERKWRIITRDLKTAAKWDTLTPALQKLGYDQTDQHSRIWYLYGHRINDVPIYPLYQWATRPATAPILELTKLLQDKYPLEYQREKWRGIGVRGKRADNEIPTYKATEPTQHQRLEAALLWRDFGREIGESARVEAALSQLLSG